MNIHNILTTKIENAGCLSAFGDTMLTAYRVLYKGKTVEVLDSGVTNENNNGETGPKTIQEKKQDMMNAALAAVIVFTGFAVLIGFICKAIAYAFADVREKYDFVQKNMSNDAVFIKYGVSQKTT